MENTRSELMSLLKIKDMSFYNMQKVDKARFILCKIKEYNDFVLTNSISSDTYSLSDRQQGCLYDMSSMINKKDFGLSKTNVDEIGNAFNCICDYYNSYDENVYSEEVNQIKQNVEELFYLLTRVVRKYTRIY